MLFPINPGRRPGSRGQSFSGGGGDESPLIVYVSPNAGPLSGGTAVTITGLGFVADAYGTIGVSFGGKSATNIVVVDRQTITCETPQQLSVGPVDVVVTVGSKTSTLFGAFTYYAITIVSIVPNHGPLSGGTPVLISGYNFKLGCTITFDSEPGTNVIFIDSEHIRCTTPAHSIGFIDVVITEP